MKCIVCGRGGDISAGEAVIFMVPTGDGRKPDIPVHLECMARERAFWNKLGEFMDNMLASMVVEQRSKR